MVLRREARRLISKAVVATVSRQRFPAGLSFVLAVFVGITMIRSVSYTAIVLLEHPENNAVFFLAATLNCVVATWTVLMTFSLVHGVAGGTSMLFFRGTTLARRFRRAWSVRLTVVRFATLGLVCYLILVVVFARLWSHTPVTILLVLIALGLAAAVVVLSAARGVATRTRGGISGIEQTTVFATALTALSGPDFRVISGEVLPVFFGTTPVSGPMITLSPLLVPFLVLLHMLIARFVIPALPSLRSGTSRSVIVSLLFRRRTLWHWVEFALIAIVLSLLTTPLLSSFVVAVAGMLGWLVQYGRYSDTLGAPWVRHRRLTELGRQVSIGAGVSFALHFVTAFVAIEIVGVFSGPA